MIEAEPIPNLESVPCMGEADTAELMENARPCRCGSQRLMPVYDAQFPPTIAVACLACDEIEGDAGTLRQAVKNWNAWTRSRHAWAGTEGDDGEVCILCGATSNDSNRDAPCPDDIEQFLTADEPPETGLADEDPQPHLRQSDAGKDGG